MNSVVSPGRSQGVFSFILSIILLLLILIQSGNASEQLDLDELLERVRVTPPARVAFVEQRKNRLLSEPMVLSGYLVYPAAGQLAKIIEQPFQETLLVDRDEIAIVRDGVERRLSLGNRKTFRVILQSIEAVMAGGAETLDEHFEAVVEGDDSAWRINLVPHSKRLSRQLIRMEVWGAGDSVEGMRFEMPEDEWQSLEIVHDGPPDE
jgi:hypothetical protein